MKLKSVLIIVFLALTLIPIVIVSVLLYKSGFDLSKQSYVRNLTESLNVQSDYISQTLDNNMISDYRFVNKNNIKYSLNNQNTDSKEGLYSAFQSYLEVSEDRIRTCILLDKNGKIVYSTGEDNVVDSVIDQLPILIDITEQQIKEFKLDSETYSLGVITPIWENSNTYAGSLVSVYEKSYIFKIISSYYKISDTSTFICRENGDIVNSRIVSNERRDEVVESSLANINFSKEGTIDIDINGSFASGYYKKIHKSSWFLVGFVDDNNIYAFTNQFVLVYIFIIIGVLIVDVILSIYFSNKVVKPINSLIKVMDKYQNNLDVKELAISEKNDYYETKYLHEKFFKLMKTIMLVRHNFDGMFQLYQSSDMGDVNIDIDVKNQTAVSSKTYFQDLMDGLILPESVCVVEKFTRCFCEKDQIMLMTMFENMRDEHLSVMREADVYTPHFDQKWFHILVVPMYTDERLSRIYVQLRDVSSFKKQEFESNELARRDSLTGLYNRAGFIERVDGILKVEDSSDLHGLMFIDMNYFKMVNDNFGHGEGDKLLCSIARILLKTISTDDTVSRFGGDEFAVFLPKTTTQEIERIKQAISSKLIFPYSSENGISFSVSASIGVSTWSNNTKNSLSELLQLADESMYAAKREFKKK